MMKYILLTVICTIVISDLGLADEVGSPSRQESIGVGTGQFLVVPLVVRLGLF